MSDQSSYPNGLQERKFPPESRRFSLGGGEELPVTLDPRIWRAFELVAAEHGHTWQEEAKIAVQSARTGTHPNILTRDAFIMHVVIELSKANNDLHRELEQLRRVQTTIRAA